MFRNQKDNFLEISKGNTKDLFSIKDAHQNLQVQPERYKITEEPNKIIIRLFAGNCTKDKVNAKKALKSKKAVPSKKEISNPFKIKGNPQKIATSSKNKILNPDKQSNEKIALIEPKVTNLNSSVFGTNKLKRAQSRNASDKTNKSNKTHSKLSPLNVKNLIEKSKEESLSKSKVENPTKNIRPKQISRRKKKGRFVSEPIIIADKIISKFRKTTKNAAPKKTEPKKASKEVTIKLPCDETQSKQPRPPSTAKKSAGSMNISKKNASAAKKYASDDTDDGVIEPWRKREGDMDDGTNNTPWSRREAGLPTRPTGCFDPSKEDECKKRKNCKFVTLREEREFIWHRTISNETPTWIFPSSITVNNDFSIRKRPFIITEKPQMNFKGLEIILPTYFNGGSRNYSHSKSGTKSACVESNQCGLKSTRDTWSPVEIKENFDQKGIPQGKKKCNSSKNKYSKFISLIKDAMSALVTVFTSHKNVQQGMKTKEA